MFQISDPSELWSKSIGGVISLRAKFLKRESFPSSFLRSSKNIVTTLSKKVFLCVRPQFYSQNLDQIVPVTPCFVTGSQLQIDQLRKDFFPRGSLVECGAYSEQFPHWLKQFISDVQHTNQKNKTKLKQNFTSQSHTPMKQKAKRCLEIKSQVARVPPKCDKVMPRNKNQIA